mgnify:CR=1 FL=1
MKSVFYKLTFLAIALLAPVMAFAQDASAAAYTNIGAAIGAGIAVGIGALGGAFGQGKAVSAALEGIARNPGSSDKIFVPMIIGLALIESLVIYALLIAFMLVGKIA